ncbi:MULTISPECIES: hypothetical protein [unclassified Paraburkholderia]|uniref:hypothetical protein n=1 Tax=unclassified Paraburkholderia TaxID=2615204 RepID=UPI0020B70288|nr:MULTISPECIES: hypothetical protein [unclassified Paraburkholderia]MCP3716556.1 hypothetical protein [Paraburkholderia sp. CNPSo 3281]MCX5539240.1 hypothetical protein [Paraburkholderia sp. CNPSo 3076]
MRSRSVPPRGERFYVLDAKNRPVEVFDRSEWSRWMAENELIFRRTLLEESGVTVTTRFRGVADAGGGEPALFVTRIAGMEVRDDNESYGASTLEAALARHERIVRKILRSLTGQ